MKIKFLIFSVLLATAPVAVMAQVPADVQQLLDEANAYLPTDAGGGMTLSSLGYDHSSLVYTMEFDDDSQGLTISMMDPKVLKQSIINNLKGNTDASVRALVQVMETHDLGMTYAFHGRRSKKTVLVHLTLDEVRSALDGAPSSTPKSKLQATIDLINAMYPMKVNENITVARVEIEVDTVFYVYEINEQYSSVDAIAVNAAGNRKALKEQFASNPSSASFMAMCKQEGKALGFRYVGKPSGKKFDLIIPVDEL
ncbi:MAG: hypothetical protein IJ634_03120 [Bacteroidales bacterium]|nr:hypothetical protein [Bacteroidales bacterium]